MNLYILSLKADSWDDLQTQVCSYWKPEPQAVFVYIESLAQCGLSCLGWTDFWQQAAIDAIWEGRCFDAGFELRWVRQSAGYLGWLTTEQSLKPEDPQALETMVCEDPVETSYYLHGQYDTRQPKTEDGRYPFREERFPNKIFYYPLPQSTSPEAGDRAYIQVKNYYRAEPDWQETTLAQANIVLDAPLLLAHRFVGLGVGQTKTEGVMTDG